MVWGKSATVLYWFLQHLNSLCQCDAQAELTFENMRTEKRELSKSGFYWLTIGRKCQISQEKLCPKLKLVSMESSCSLSKLGLSNIRKLSDCEKEGSHVFL